MDKTTGTIYRTSDGEEFASEIKAIQHENGLNAQNRNKLLQEMLDAIEQRRVEFFKDDDRAYKPKNQEEINVMVEKIGIENYYGEIEPGKWLIVSSYDRGSYGDYWEVVNAYTLDYLRESIDQFN